MAHIRQSRPDSSLVFQQKVVERPDSGLVLERKVVQTVQVVSSLLGFEVPDRAFLLQTVLLQDVPNPLPLTAPAFLSHTTY